MRATFRTAFDTTSVVELCRRTTSLHGRDGRSLLSNEITELSQRAAVEVVPGRVRQPRDDLGGDAAAAFRPRRARPRPRARRSGVGTRPTPGADDERDLALRRLGEAAPRAPPRCRARPPRTASSARGTRRPRAPASTAASERSDAAQALRRLERDDRPPPRRESRARARRARPPCRGRKPTNAYALADEPARDERRLDRGRPGQHRHRRRPRRAPRARAARPGSEIAGIPASRDERDPLARLEPRQQLRDARRLVVLVVGEQRRASIPCRSSSPRVWRVSSASTTSASRSSSSTRSVTSSRFPIGVAQTASGTARYASAFERDQRGADQPGLAAELGAHEPHLLAGRRERLAAASRAPRRPRRSRSNAAMPKPPPITTTRRAEDVDERADRRSPRWWPISPSAGCRCSTRSCAVASGPSTRCASRSAARARSSTPRRGRGRSTRPGTARRPRRSPCGRARPSRGRAARRRRRRRRRRCRASAARGRARRGRRRA